MGNEEGRYEIERDMKVRGYAGKDPSKKIFDENPLIGNYIPGSKMLSWLTLNAKSCLRQILGDGGARRSKNIEMADRVITIMVIHYAQGWSSSEDNSFWGYIVRQFGYNKGEENPVRAILCESVKNALIMNGRFFLQENSRSNRYKSSILVHALSTKETWMLLYDFLFKFYKENLDWNYDANDPIIARMVYLLKRKLEKEDEDEEELQISSKVFYFQEGVKKLIVNRPNYTIEVFKRMLKRIDDLCNGNAENSHLQYIDQLGNEWYQKKVNDIAASDREGRRKYSRRNVAIDYSRIRAVYIIDDGKLCLELPDVRLKDPDISRIEIIVMRAGTESHRTSMAFYGDEIGKTMIGTRLPVENISGIEEGFSIRVKILCDGESIYDSRENLFRKAIFFKGKNEQNSTMIIPGSYRAILPADSEIEIDGGKCEEYDESDGLKEYDIELAEGFTLSIDGEVLAVDKADGQDIKVIFPVASSDMIYCEGAEQYKVFQHDFTIQVVVKNDTGTNRFIASHNDKKITNDEIKIKHQDGLSIYTIRMESTDSAQSVSIIDLESEKNILREKFIICKNLEYGFNRSIYICPDDYSNACVRLNTGESVPISMFEEYASLPFINGTLMIRIPKVTLEDIDENAVIPDGSILWHEEAKNLELISVNAPSETDIRITVGNLDVAELNGKYEIGNTIRQIDDKNDSAEIKLYVNGEAISIKTIALREAFAGDVSLLYDNGRLTWNKGIRFIGNQSQTLTVKIIGNGQEYTFQILPSADEIAHDIMLEVGYYNFEISLEKQKLFSKESRVLSKGRFIAGDINALRFRDKIIKIDHIKYYFSDAKPVMEIGVDNLYVDQIEYQGTYYIDSEECELPVYKGVLYYIKFDGTRVYYSFNEHISKSGRKKIKLNPVKLICMSEGYMIITDEEDDGLEFLIKHTDYEDKVNILDYEYTPKKSIFGVAESEREELADVYGYETEDIGNV